MSFLLSIHGSKYCNICITRISLKRCIITIINKALVTLNNSQGDAKPLSEGCIVSVMRSIHVNSFSTNQNELK